MKKLIPFLFILFACLLMAPSIYFPVVTGGIATATPTSSPTPTSPPEEEGIINGDFESGRFVGWSEYSSIPDKEIVAEYPELFPTQPHSGEWGAWFGGIVSAPTKYDIIEQTSPLTVTAASKLSLWYFVNSQENCPHWQTTCWDCMKVLIKHPEEPPTAWQQVWKQDACYEENSSVWEYAEFDIPLGVWTVRIWFQYGSDIWVSNILVDDVGLKSWLR